MTLEHLPNGIKQLAEKRINEQKDTWHCYEIGCSIGSFFNWGETREGSYFWGKIACGDFLPYYEKYSHHNWINDYPNEFVLYKDGDKSGITAIGVDDYIPTKVEDTTTAYKESNGKLFYEIDWPFITQMAERMAANKKDGKYELFNWKKPMDEKGIEDLKQAMLRHLIEILNGVYEDDGREFGHLESIACNSLMLNYQLKNLK